MSPTKACGPVSIILKSEQVKVRAQGIGLHRPKGLMLSIGLYP